MYGAWSCEWRKVKLATCPLLVVVIHASHYILAHRMTPTVAVSFQSSVTHSPRTRLLIKCSGVRFTYDWIIHIVKAVHVAQTVSAADAWTTTAIWHLLIWAISLLCFGQCCQLPAPQIRLSSRPLCTIQVFLLYCITLHYITLNLECKMYCIVCVY